MEHLGAQLRTVRQHLGKKLSEVAARSAELAANRGTPRYKISISWLNRIENDAQREIGAYPLIALLEIYAITLEELLTIDPHGTGSAEKAINGSARTSLIVEAPDKMDVALLLPDDSSAQPIPVHTELVRRGVPQSHGQFLRAVIGKEKNYLWPLVPPGTLVLVDTHRRSLLVNTSSEVEIQRPMFLLELRSGHACCWCELVDKNDGRLVVLPHPASRLKAFQLRLGKDVSIRGQVVTVRIPVVPEGDRGHALRS